MYMSMYLLASKLVVDTVHNVIIRQTAVFDDYDLKKNQEQVYHMHNMRLIN
jgi:hypothetical protein